MANEKMNETELDQVTGGYDPFGGVPTNGGTQANRSNLGDRINLVGPYYSTSFAEGQAYRAAIGWNNLYAVLVYSGRPAGYRIRQANGEDVGWAPAGSIQFI